MKGNARICLARKCVERNFYVSPSDFFPQRGGPPSASWYIKVVRVLRAIGAKEGKRVVPQVQRESGH